MDYTDVPVLLKEYPLNDLLCASPLLCPTQNSFALQRRWSLVPEDWSVAVTADQNYSNVVAPVSSSVGQN